MQLNGSGIYVTKTPDDIVGSATTSIATLFVDGSNTTVVATGVPPTSIKIEVPDLDRVETSLGSSVTTTDVDAIVW